MRPVGDALSDGVIAEARAKLAEMAAQNQAYALTDEYKQKVAQVAEMRRLNAAQADQINAAVKQQEAIAAQRLIDEREGRIIQDRLKAQDAKFTADNAAIADFIRTSSAKFTADNAAISAKFTADNAAIAQAISNPAAAALQTSVAGTDTRVIPTTVALPDSSSTSTPSTGTNPLTIAAIGFGVLKLLAVI